MSFPGEGLCWSPVVKRFAMDVVAHGVKLVFVMDDGSQDSIEVTADHPFWVVSSESLESRLEHQLIVSRVVYSAVDAGRWVAARSVMAGDRLRMKDGRMLVVIRAEDSLINTRVFNISVQGTQNYFVSKAGILVHNKI
jgi:hypothetical protein